MIGEIEKRACESSNCQEGKDSLGFQGGRLKNESPEARNKDKKCLINTKQMVAKRRVTLASGRRSGSEGG